MHELNFPSSLFSFALSNHLSVVTHCSVHCGSIRQTATILSMNRDCLRTGDKASVHFRFIKTPEYLHCDQRLVFREGRTKAVGTITKVVQPSGRSRAYAYTWIWLTWWVVGAQYWPKIQRYAFSPENDVPRRKNWAPSISHRTNSSQVNEQNLWKKS